MPSLWIVLLRFLKCGLCLPPQAVCLSISYLCSLHHSFWICNKGNKSKAYFLGLLWGWKRKKRSRENALNKTSNTVSTQLMISIIVGTSVAKSEKRATAQKMLEAAAMQKGAVSTQEPRLWVGTQNWNVEREWIEENLQNRSVVGYTK